MAIRVIAISMDGAYGWPQGGGWYALGPGGRHWARLEMRRLKAAGYRPVGRGKVPKEASEVRLGPTGGYRRGGPSLRAKVWIGRWWR